MVKWVNECLDKQLVEKAVLLIVNLDRLNNSILLTLDCFPLLSTFHILCNEEICSQVDYLFCVACMFSVVCVFVLFHLFSYEFHLNICLISLA